MARKDAAKDFDLFAWLTKPAPLPRSKRPTQPPPKAVSPTFVVPPDGKEKKSDSAIKPARAWPVAAFLTEEEPTPPSKRRRKPPVITQKTGRPSKKLRRECVEYAIWKILGRRDIVAIAEDMHISVNTLARWIVEELTRKSPILSLYEEVDSRGITLTLPSGAKIKGASLAEVVALERDVLTSKQGEVEFCSEHHTSGHDDIRPATSRRKKLP